MRSTERAARNYIRQKLGIDYSIVIVGSAAGVIQDPNIPGNVLVRIKASNGFMVPFSVGKPVIKVQLTVGKAVELEYKRGKLRIAGLDNDGIITSGGDPLADTNDTDFNKQESLATLGVTQTQPVSTTVKVKAWNPIVSGTAYEFPGGEIDIATAGSGSSSLIPTSGNMARIVIFVKNDYVTLEAKSSTPRGMTDVILSVADTNEAIALRTAGSTPVWAIDLFNAQTTISQGDIQNGRDLRNLVNNLDTYPGGALTVLDSQFTIQDNAAPTKQFQFQASGITAGQTRIYTVPDYNATLATLAGTETLTNKTLTTPIVDGTITQIIGGVSLIISHAYSGSNRTTGLIITTPGASTDNVIQPSGDFKALIVKGNASQTANLQEWQNSGGTQLAAISSIGHATFGSSTTPPATTIITSVKTFTDPAAQTFALNATVTSALTANNANALRGAQMAATSDPNGNNQTGTVVGGLFLGTSTGTGGTISTVHGGQFGIQNAGTSVTMTNARGIYVQSPTNSGTITVLTGILIDAQNTAGITTVRALDIINQGASNTAIRAGTGLVQFGDRVNIIGSQDAVQLIVRANATQTSNLTEWQNSSATILTKVNGSGNVGVRMGSTALTAYLHIAAGTTSASTAPIKLTSGTSMTAAEAGAIEFTTDDLFFTITTGTARKRILFADPSGGLTSGRVPFATTNGRLTDSADLTWDGSVLDVAGTLRGNALRLDLSPTSETITPTHTITISVNGTDYKIPIVAA